MTNSISKILDLFFNPGETICVSNGKFAYHSINKEDILLNQITLASPNPKVGPQTISSKDVCLFGINPIKGFRNDQNVTTYRSFLIELDDGSLSGQYEYIKQIKFPYSSMVFSGNKSLHVCLSLAEDLPTENLWRFFNEWILNILSRADQQNKNPSRSTRFPGHIRLDGKQLEQKAIEIKERVPVNVFYEWLNKYPDKQPKINKKSIILKDYKKMINPYNLVGSLPQWIKNKLREGISEDRNKTWFCIASHIMENSSLDHDEIVGFLQQFFQEERDFKYKEWILTIRSAFKHYCKKL